MHRPAALIALVFVLGLAACRAPQAGEAVSQGLPAGQTSTALTQPTASATPSFDELLTLAQDTANSGDWAGAIALLDQAILMNNTNAQAFLLRGNVYKASGDLAQAINNYDQAVAIDPNLSAAFQNRGLAYAELGETTQALADLSHAIEISPGFALAYRNRAELQRSLGNTSAASFDLQVYLSLVPNAPDRAAVEAEIAALQEETAQNAGEEGLLFFDDFSDPNSGWYTNGDPVSTGSYSGGGYVLVEKQLSTAVWALPGRIFSDVRIEVMATKQAGDEKSNWFGVMCRVQGTTGSAKFYMLMVTSDGYYGIAKRIEEDSFELIQQDALLFSSAINQGNSTNKITGICSGNQLALYVNDQLLVDVTDSDLASGQVGMFAGTFAEAADTSIFFDDFEVFSEPAQ